MAHVVHLTTVHLPFDTRIFQKECRSLAKEGYRVSLIVPHVTHESVDGVDIIPLPRFHNRLIRMSRGVREIYRFARRLEADLYHCHDPELMPVGIMLKLSTRARVVYDVHEDYPKNMRSKKWLFPPLRFLASWGMRGCERVTAGLVNGIVAATEHIATRFPPKRTHVVRNHPLLEMMSHSPDHHRKFENNLNLIYTGGITDHRGIQQIVQALDYVKTPQARLILLGRNMHPYIADEIRSMPGYRRVEYLGHVPYETMFRHLDSAAIGLICNQPRYGYDLALPNKLFEYMSAGLPIIASNFKSWEEIVKGNDCGIMVDPTSPEEIATAIDYLLSNPGIRRLMGRKARQAVKQRYNWEQEEKKLLKLYRELLN